MCKPSIFSLFIHSKIKLNIGKYLNNTTKIPIVNILYSIVVKIILIYIIQLLYYTNYKV